MLSSRAVNDHVGLLERQPGARIQLRLDFAAGDDRAQIAIGEACRVFNSPAAFRPTMPTTVHRLAPTLSEVATHTQAFMTSSIVRTNARAASGTPNHTTATLRTMVTNASPATRAAPDAGRSCVGRQSIYVLLREPAI